MTERHLTDNHLIDRVAASIHDEQLDPILERDVTDRVWARIVEETGGANQTPLRTCEDFQELIPDHVAGRLSEPRSLLVGDHTRECLSCRRALMAARRSAGAEPLTARPPSRRTIPVAIRWAAAAVLVVGVSVLGWRLGGTMLAERGLHASVMAVDGGLYLVSDDRARVVTPGQLVRARQRVRTARASGALLELGDGSTIEMDERSEILLRSAGGGTTIDLERGNIIVHAADQGPGHLFVSTHDCLVAVKGTIFSVNHGLKGSRVSVIEGEVEVSRGSECSLLFPGDQVTTDARLRPVPVEREIAWSRNAPEHLALLRELRLLRREMESKVELPTARTSTRLLDLAPADTLIFAALPNVTEGLVTARQVFADRLASSDILRSWWQANVVTSGLDAEIDGLFDRLRPLGESVGDEVVITVPQAAIDANGGPVILAGLDDPAGFALLLADEVERVNATGDAVLALLSDPWQAVPPETQWLLWVSGDVFVATTDQAQLQGVASVVLEQSPNVFVDTDLHAGLAEAYASGVEWLLGLDLGTVLSTAALNGDPDELEILRQTGLLDATTLILEHHHEGDGAATQASLDFAGPRQGLASWLAAPAPMGSLDFISPRAVLAAGVVARDAELMFDDLIGLLETVDSGAISELHAFQREHGIDVREDLFAPLGGEAAIAVDGPLLPIPGWKLVIEVYDPAALQHAIEWAVDEVNRACADEGCQGLELEETTVGGNPAHSLRLLDTGTEVHYVIVDGFVVVAPGRGLLELALQYRETGTGLPRSTSFRELLPANGFTDCSALLYRNLSGLTDAVAGLGLEGLDPEAHLALSELGAESLFCIYGEDSRITAAGSGGSLLASMLGLPAIFGDGATMPWLGGTAGERVSS